MTRERDRVFVRLSPSTFRMLCDGGVAVSPPRPRRSQRRRSTAQELADLCARLAAHFGGVW